MHKLKLSVQDEMCLLLNCEDDTYSSIIYKYGLAYLMWYLPCNPRQRRILEGSKVFWNWFKTQWYIHDQALIDDAEFHQATIKERRLWFKRLHCPQAMAAEVKPNSIVIAELYKKEKLCY